MSILTKFKPSREISSMVTEKEQEKEKMIKNKNREKLSNHGVIITVYVESPPTSHQLKNIDPSHASRRKRSSSKPPLPARHGYDRKAQLLAYARQLRCSNSQEIEWHERNLRPKSKWSLGPSTVKIRLSFQRIFPMRRWWGYERIVSKDRLFGGRRIHQNKTTAASGRSSSHQLCKRLRRMLKDLSCGWKCNKG